MSLTNESKEYINSNPVIAKLQECIKEKGISITWKTWMNPEDIRKGGDYILLSGIKSCHDMNIVAVRERFIEPWLGNIGQYDTRYKLYFFMGALQGETHEQQVAMIKRSSRILTEQDSKIYDLMWRRLREFKSKAILDNNMDDKNEFLSHFKENN